MTRVGITIGGVPDFRYDAARESRARWARAVAAIGVEPGAPCCWVLVDTLKQRPNVEYFWDRAARGWVRPEEAFGELLEERIPGSGFTVKPKDPSKPAVFYEFYRHEVHFGAITVYEPMSQAELDARRVRREARALERERAGAPLFNQDG